MSDEEPVNEDDQTEEPVPDIGYGRRMRIRKRPEFYVPSIEGKFYKVGVNNLCYRGTRYMLEVATPGVSNMPYRTGVLNVNFDAPVMAPEPE